MQACYHLQQPVHHFAMNNHADCAGGDEYVMPAVDFDEYPAYRTTSAQLLPLIDGLDQTGAIENDDITWNPHFYTTSSNPFPTNYSHLPTHSSSQTAASTGDGTGVFATAQPSQLPTAVHDPYSTHALCVPQYDHFPQLSYGSYTTSERLGRFPIRHSRQASDTSCATTAGPSTPPAHAYPVPRWQPTQTWYDSVPSRTTAVASAHRATHHSHIPRSIPHTSVAHAALRDMAIDQHASATAEDVPDLLFSRQSTSSQGQSTPMTPRDELEERANKPAPNEYSRGPVELYRTESAACQDELFNPANFSSTQTSQPDPQPAKPESSSPKSRGQPQADLVSERLKTAESVRTHGAGEPDARQRSPFRKGAEFAPESFSRTASTMPSAAGLRQRQKDQSDQKEFRAHQPALKREMTKTMSPKDALLDVPDHDKASSAALDDIIPEGYQKHFGGSETFATNYVTGSTQAFGQFVPLNQNVGGFRGVDLNNFLQSPMPDPVSYAAPPFSSTQESERPPEFPAHLTTMESSASENVPASSQDSSTSPVTVKRPANTSANTGSYTCTAPDCHQRFESAVKLARHKRDVHPPTPAAMPSATPSSARTSPSASPSSSTAEDSEALGSGMSSSALLARNSQAGPHKCTRINPTTGRPCNTIFSRPYDLTRHEDTIHDRIKQKVQCQYCNEEKTFSRNDALTRHMRVVHPEIDFQPKRGKRDYS